MVILVWAAIYLPRLGSLEIKSEEGRRILPAVTMLETGNYLVPQVGSEPYLRKPPLVNWLVAGSFQALRRAQRMDGTASLGPLRSRGRARLRRGRPRRTRPQWLARRRPHVADQFRPARKRPDDRDRSALRFAHRACLHLLAELVEGTAAGSPGRQPGFFSGSVCSRKGRCNLLFFYAVVLAVLWQAAELRRLWSRPHLLGIILMLGIFAAWAIPYLQTMQAGHVANVWSRQFSGRMSGDDFKLANWLLNIPRGIAYLLPWAALLPFARFALLENAEDRKFCRALSLGVALPFLVVNLIPGALPRYNMPLLAPAIWLLAIFIREHALVWPKPLRKAITWTVAAIDPRDALLFARAHSGSATPGKNPPDRGPARNRHSAQRIALCGRS